ncbi:MAG: hypothetical protein EFT35_01885 [Methanophagales archaeon ANME-1-THS]|nr:MAG: hypothetical protein EFT35_01885 [Methanophagales archaeon ANME-1-THS]
MMEELIEIHIKLWWRQEIRKITVKKGEACVVIRLKNMGYVSMSDERTQNIFAGIIKGLLGIKGEMSAVQLAVRRDGTEKSLIVKRIDDLEEIVRKTFIEA